MTKRGGIGSSFDDYLEEEGIQEEATASAIKRVLAWQLEQAMQAENISKSEMARRMGTSRSELYRLLDPDNDKVLLHTLQRAATILGRQVRVELVDAPPPRMGESPGSAVRNG